MELGQEWEKILKEIIHLYSHALAHATPQHKNLCPGGHEICNIGRPFLGHHYFILILSDLCLRVEKKFSKEIMHFQYMTYSTLNSCIPGSCKLQFWQTLSCSSLGLLYTQFVWTMHRSREKDFLSQPIAIGHLSEKSPSPGPLCLFQPNLTQSILG